MLYDANPSLFFTLIPLPPYPGSPFCLVFIFVRLFRMIILHDQNHDNSIACSLIILLHTVRPAYLPPVPVGRFASG